MTSNAATPPAGTTPAASLPPTNLPPYARLLGIALSVDPRNGQPPVLRMDFADALAGRPGMLHGGAIAGLLEMAARAALHANLLAAGQDIGFKPIGITIDYVRGGRHLPTFARGKVTRVGKRVATVVVEAWQGDENAHIAAARMHMLMAGGGDAGAQTT
ncbi:MAG: PaaI family thioesterase [Sphingopyxis sp.]